MDWEQYVEDENQGVWDEVMEASDAALVDAQVLLAADVAYDIQGIPSLVRTVRHFLSSGEREKVAIFATTLRNRKTFDAFEQHLFDQDISCDYVESEALESMQYVFPVYNVQPRSDVRICFMRLSSEVSPTS